MSASRPQFRRGWWSGTAVKRFFSMALTLKCSGAFHVQLRNLFVVALALCGLCTGLPHGFRRVWFCCSLPVSAGLLHVAACCQGAAAFCTWLWRPGGQNFSCLLCHSLVHSWTVKINTRVF